MFLDAVLDEISQSCDVRGAYLRYRRRILHALGTRFWFTTLSFFLDTISLVLPRDLVGTCLYPEEKLCLRAHVYFLLGSIPGAPNHPSFTIKGVVDNAWPTLTITASMRKNDMRSLAGLELSCVHLSMMIRGTDHHSEGTIVGLDSL